MKNETLLTLIGFVIFMMVIVTPIVLFIQGKCQDNKNYECVENTRLAQYWFIFASAIPLSIIGAVTYGQMLKGT